MYKQIAYIDEYNKMNRNKIVIFCTIIGIITVILVIITGILTYQIIKNSTAREMEIAGAKTVGISQLNEGEQMPYDGVQTPTTQESPTEEKSEQQESTEQNTETNSNLVEQYQEVAEEVSNFPKHDFSADMDSQLPQYSDAIAEKVVNVYYEKAKKIYLTFDDGPSKQTPKILDTLDKYNVKATFFVLGRNVVNYPELVKREYDSGHFIANHGYSHEYSQIYSSPQTVLDEYNQTVDAIRNAIGVPNYNPHLFRFPGGSVGGKYASLKKSAIELLRENQIAHTNWNCLSGDAEGKNTIEAMWEEIRETAVGDDNLVILMHDAADKSVTAEFLPQLIEYYQGQGYEFASYYDVMSE